MEDYTIALADDHRSFLDGIAMRLAIEPGLEVVGTAFDGFAALELVGRLSPDLLVLDIQMPRLSGVEVTRELARTASRTKVLPLSSHADPRYILSTFQSGAYGYLAKDESLSTIVGAIWTILKGGVYVGSLSSVRSGYGNKSIDSAPQETAAILAKAGVSPRLLLIFQQVALGKSNKEIALQVTRSEYTIRNQVAKIKKLINVRWRPEAVAWAWKNRVHDLDAGSYEQLYWEKRVVARAPEGYASKQVAMVPVGPKGLANAPGI